MSFEFTFTLLLLHLHAITAMKVLVEFVVKLFWQLKFVQNCPNGI